jgi:hypothetical protein
MCLKLIAWNSGDAVAELEPLIRQLFGGDAAVFFQTNWFTYTSLVGTF